MATLMRADHSVEAWSNTWRSLAWVVGIVDSVLALLPLVLDPLPTWAERGIFLWLAAQGITILAFLARPMIQRRA